MRAGLPEFYARAVDDIRRGRVKSSSESVLYALSLLSRALQREKDLALFAALATEIVRSRPTSALMLNMVREVLRAAVASVERGLDEVSAAVEERRSELEKTLQDHVARAALIAEKRLEDGDVVLTNTYSVFVKRTVLSAVKSGKKLSVVVAESRPGGEGAELAAELADAGVPTQLVVDSAVRFIMREVDKVLVGSEAIAANGANINKVGTSLIALAAHEARVRVFVVASSLKLSPETLVGELLEIPEADYEWGLESPGGRGKLKVRAPLFDVTPPQYIDAIVTERGLIAPQFAVMLVREIYGWPPALQSVSELAEELLRRGLGG
ncbi:MAG: hypothetical protein QW498_01760 [Thermofilum sp.]